MDIGCIAFPTARRNGRRTQPERHGSGTAKGSSWARMPASPIRRRAPPVAQARSTPTRPGRGRRRVPGRPTALPSDQWSRRRDPPGTPCRWSTVRPCGSGGSSARRALARLPAASGRRSPVRPRVRRCPARGRRSATVHPSRFPGRLRGTARPRRPNRNPVLPGPWPPSSPPRSTWAALRPHRAPSTTSSRPRPGPTRTPPRSTTAVAYSTTPRSCARSTPSAPGSARPGSAWATGSASASRPAPPTSTSRSSRC